MLASNHLTRGNVFKQQLFLWTCLICFLEIIYYTRIFYNWAKDMLCLISMVLNTIRQITEEVRAKNLEAILILFVDFSKPFDSIHRRKMVQILLAYGLPKETVKWCFIKTKKQGFAHMIETQTSSTLSFEFCQEIHLHHICLWSVQTTYVLQKSIDQIKENGYTLIKKQNKTKQKKTTTKKQRKKQTCRKTHNVQMIYGFLDVPVV